jgi:heavy metal sensor kinase
VTNSLRFRLTALYLGLFATLFLLFSLGLYAVLSRSLSARMDAALATEADTAVVLFLDEMSETDGDGRQSALETIAGMKLHGDVIAVVEGSTTLASSEARAVGAHRAVERRVESFGHAFNLIVSAPMESIEGPLALARRAILFGLPIVLCLAGGGGWLLATRALAPLRSVADQSARITGNTLHTRLDPGRATDELRVLTDSFNDLLSRLDQSFETMRRFVADASHELRTPVSVIRGEADVALSRDRSPAEYRESLTTVLEESRRLSRLIDDLLKLARADAGHVRLHSSEFYLNELLAECCRAVQPLAVARGLDVECRASADFQYCGDEELLRRLILNLLDNAIRYTPSGGHVTATVEGGASGIRILVADTGIGIPADQAARVFERFYRVDEGRSRMDGGFGLGLSIVRWIAEAHRGVVECVSTPGVGSTFTVTLPT